MTTVIEYRNPEARPSKNYLGEPGYRWVALSCGHSAFAKAEPGESYNCTKGELIPGSVHWRWGLATQEEAAHAIRQERIKEFSE